MKNMVIFRDNQELDSDDLNNIEVYARSSFDTLISDAIASDPLYAGFGCSQTAATQVTLAPGRYYNAGAAYELTTPTVIDFFSQLPLVTQKWCAVVVNGQDIQTDVEPRDFLIDATTGATQPQSVAMEDSRIAVLNSVAGVESPQPSYPSTGSTVTVIAYVLLATTGVAQVIQYTATQLPQLEAVESQVDALQLWQQQIGAQVNTLGTALANLQAAANGFATLSMVQALVSALNNTNNLLGQVAANLAALSIKVSEPAAYIFYGRNYFLDDSGSDVGNGSFTALINEGLRFPMGAQSVVTLTLLNPLDPNAAVNSGFMIPVHTSKLRMSCAGYSAELQIGQFPFQSALSCTLLRRRRHRRRCGPPFTPSASANWWQVGAYDPVAATLAFNGETFGALSVASYVESVNPSNPQAVVGSYDGCRRSQYWEDDFSQPYWNRVTSNASVSGQQVGQTFLNAQDGWISQIGLFFTRAGATGDVDIKICNVDNQNRPDLTHVICSLSLPVGNIKTGSLSSGGGLPVLVETLAPIPPTFLAGGVRYAIVLTTSGAHYLAATTSDSLVLQGNYFWADSTQTFNVNSTQNIRLNFYYANFALPYYECQMQPLSLSGGIAAIDVLAEAQEPSAAGLSYQVQIAGVWYALDAAGSGPNLSSAPTLLPLKAAFAGTTDLMCGLGLTQSQVTLSAPQPMTATYLSLSETLGTASQNLKISVTMENFNGSIHTCTITLNSGGSHSATSVVDTVQPDGSLLRQATFTLGSTITTYVIEIVMATSVAGSTFQIRELDQYAA